MMTLSMGGGVSDEGTPPEVLPLHVELARPEVVVEEVDDLFRRSGRVGFQAFSERSYGGTGEWATQCVIARNAEERVFMHLGLLPRTFRSPDQDGERTGVGLRAALVMDLISDAAHRDFWSPISFVRQAVDLLRSQGRYDFLYTDPGATTFGILRAAGFSVMASLSRYVLPLVPDRLAAFSAREEVEGLEAEVISWSEGLFLANQLTHLTPGKTFFIRHSDTFLKSRAWSWLTPSPDWLAFRKPDAAAGEGPVALLLALPILDARTLSIVDLRWDVGGVAFESVLSAAARVARKQGFRKLDLRVMSNSSAADALRRCGFRMREGDHPILTRLLRDDLELPPASEWTLTWLDASAW
ncbi:MAG: hypothetical protein RQ745_04305 [Longimicrobiales bacterium]|nr:hypothetical protein [Longimicrobiales bacterium]